MYTLAGESLRVHMSYLRAVGYLRIPRDASYSLLMTSLHEGYRLFVLAMTCLYLLLQLVYCYQVQNDMIKLSRVLFLTLCHLTSLSKQIVFHKEAARIDQVIAGLDDILFNPLDPSFWVLLRTTAKDAHKLVKIYAGTAVVTCILWVIFPIVDHARGSYVEFPVWVHMDYTTTPMFVLVLLYTYLMTTIVGIANTTMDAFMATILSQNKTQLSILRHKLEHLADHADEDSARSGASRDTVLMRRFLNCLAHYGKVVESVNLFQDIFGNTILLQFSIGGWILCMAAYKIVSLNVLSIEFASMILFILCILTELFLYCYYGNEVSVESDKLVGSLYLMRWDDAGVRFRRALILAMERAKRPLRPTAGKVVPLSLNTFTQEELIQRNTTPVKGENRGKNEKIFYRIPYPVIILLGAVLRLATRFILRN